MIYDQPKLQRLIEEYGQLRKLTAQDASKRGQRFNHFLAELLQCWGIEACPSVRGSGEIDVGFESNGQRFVVEAKWEQDRTDTGPIAKLQKRLRQRLGGTVGLFVSMSGYTEDALGDLKEGEQLAVLCLTREHVEAMLSGFIPPSELLSRLVTRASIRGDAYVPISSLFEPSPADQPGFSFEAPAQLNDLVEKSVPGLIAAVAISSLPLGQSGVASLASNRILLTLSSGVFQADLERRTVEPWLPIPHCSRNVLVVPDGGAYLVRRAGVARLRDDRLTPVAGGLSGNVSLSLGTGGEVWAFANGDPDGVTPATLTRLGESFGEQETFPLNYAPASGVNAAQVDPDTFLVVGSAGTVTIKLASSETETITRDLTNPMGLSRVSPDRFVVASDCTKPLTPTSAKSMVCLSEINTTSRTVTPLAQLNLQGSVSELAMDADGTGYLFSHFLGEGIVVRFRR